jgi:hypothetical protein
MLDDICGSCCGSRMYLSYLRLQLLVRRCYIGYLTLYFFTLLLTGLLTFLLYVIYVWAEHSYWYVMQEDNIWTTAMFDVITSTYLVSGEAHIHHSHTHTYTHTSHGLAIYTYITRSGDTHIHHSVGRYTHTLDGRTIHTYITLTHTYTNTSHGRAIYTYITRSGDTHIHYMVGRFTNTSLDRTVTSLDRLDNAPHTLYNDDTTHYIYFRV